jgi:hypothetical protein
MNEDPHAPEKIGADGWAYEEGVFGFFLPSHGAASRPTIGLVAQLRVQLPVLTASAARLGSLAVHSATRGFH